MSTTISILTYHQIAPTLPQGFERYSVTVAQFAAQLAWLKLAGYQSISFDQWLAARTGQLRLPKRPVLISFDDGLRDCVHYAAPLLLEHGLTGMFFLVAGLIGQQAGWLAAEGAPIMPLSDWDTLRELLRNGLDCGGHSYSHPRLAELAPDDCAQELRQSRQTLEEHLKAPIRHMAYPFGSWNNKVCELAAQAGFASACTTAKGRASLRDNPLSLRRVPVYSSESMPEFALRVTTGHTLRELFQRAIRGKR